MPTETRAGSLSTASATPTSITITKEELDSLIKTAVESALKTTTTFFQGKLDELNALIDEQSEKIDQLRLHTKNLEKETNNLEQYSRRSNIRITGLVVNETNPDYKQCVCDFVGRNLTDKEGNAIIITPDDIDAAHPLPSRDQTKTATIIVKFHSREKRDIIIKHRRDLKGKKMAISEDLTSKNIKLLKELNSSPDFSSAWSWGGKVFAIHTTGGKPHKFDIHDV